MKKIKLSKRKRHFLVRAILCACGLMVLLITMPTNSYAFNTQVIDWAINELCGHITGYLGALLTSVAVLGAIVSAAMGSYRVFFGAIIVAVGSFATPDILEFYFPAAAAQCTPAGGGGAPKSADVFQTNLPSTAVVQKSAAKSSVETSNMIHSNSNDPSLDKSNAEDDDAEISRSWGNLSSEE